MMMENITEICIQLFKLSLKKEFPQKSPDRGVHRCTWYLHIDSRLPQRGVAFYVHLKSRINAVSFPRTERF
jgi:hypothetical protein